MKKFILSLLVATSSFAQQAVELDAKSVRLPRYADLSSVQASIPAAKEGMMVYSSNTKSLLLHDGTTWENLNRYQNFRQFLSSTTWTVPANVTTVLVEAWGAGGGGNGIFADPSTTTNGYGSGGGGGGYAKALFNVTPGTILTITVGTGGARGSGGLISSYIPAQNGGASSVATPTQNLTVNGGFGALNSSSGIGATTFSTSSLASFLFEPGKNGQYQKTIYQQSSATDFWKVTNFGDGGDAGNNKDSGGKGGSYSRNITTLAAGTVIFSATGAGFGGGGGGGYPPAGNGANGAVVIYY
jgi:hypothetical protein